MFEMMKLDYIKTTGRTFCSSQIHFFTKSYTVWWESLAGKFGEFTRFEHLAKKSLANE